MPRRRFDPLLVFGAPLEGGGLLVPAMLDQWYVNASPTGQAGDGRAYDHPLATIAEAITAAASGDVIFVAPGDYTDELTIPVGKSNLTILGAARRGSVYVSVTGAVTALTNNANGTRLINITIEGDETAGSIGLLNRGRGLRYSVGRILNLETCAQFTLGTPTEVDAGTYGDGSDTLCEDVEFSWATDGVDLVGVTDVGVGDFGTTQNYFRRCTFHNLSNSSFKETPLGVATQSFRDLEVSDCIFRRIEAGTEPTYYMLLNGSNSNSGMVTRCSFPTALAGGKNLVSTAVIWVSNYHTDGVSTTVPS